MPSDKKSKIYIITGPTAGGKSDHAVNLAHDLYKKENKKYNIISADSRQIYKYLDIGSGKIPKEEMRNIVHYGLDIADPECGRAFGAAHPLHKKFTAANWLSYTQNKIQEILEMGEGVIICGGTGLYIDALLYGITDNPAPDPAIRKELEDKNLNILELQNIVKDLNSEYFESLNNSEKNNRERLIRKIEILKQNKNIINTNHEKVLKYDVNFILIDPEINILKENIKIRLEKRLYPVGDFAKSENNALINEVKDLLENKKVDPEWLISLGLEYKYITMYIQNKITFENMKIELENKIYQYAKRQKTWNKRYVNLLK